MYPVRYLTPEQKSSLLVSGHAVVRYRQRSGDHISSPKRLVEKVKELVRTHPEVSDGESTSYIRVSGHGHDPIWIVVKGRVVITVLEHQQYLRKIEREEKQSHS